MKLTNKPTIEEIEQTIRAVAAAESPRYFKSEVNSPDRTFLVATILAAQITVALYDLGLGFSELIAINPVDILNEQMHKDGYEGVNFV